MYVPYMAVLVVILWNKTQSL